MIGGSFVIVFATLFYAKEERVFMDFSRLSEGWEEELIQFRRQRHQHPENAWTEFLTTSEIIKKLEEYEIPYLFGRQVHTKGERYGVPSEEVLQACMERAVSEGADPKLVEQMRGGYTGVVGILDTGKPGPVTAMRFDIDCNDVGECQDSSHFPAREGFASMHPNLMHACGHDVHTAIGIGMARFLSLYRDQLCGTIKLIFQAAEEGARGGESMAASGLLEDVDYLFGGHVADMTSHLGEFAASTINGSISYKVDLIFKGLSAHAGMAPEKGKNALAAAASAILNLLAISRHSGGRTRVNVGACTAGPGRNVIPDYALLKAEVRGLTEELNEYMFQRMLTVSRAAAEMYDCEFSYRIMGHSIDAPCDKEMVDLAYEAAKETEGVTLMNPSHDMLGGGEDVTFMMREVQKHGGKATFMWLGCDSTAPNHNSCFSITEDVIPLTVRLFGTMVMKLNGIL